jgi:hypothetical protein
VCAVEPIFFLFAKNHQFWFLKIWFLMQKTS